MKQACLLFKNKDKINTREFHPIVKIKNYFRMKTIKNLVFIILLLANLTTFGQATLTGTVYTEIVPLTSASELRQLSFGQFTPIGGGGNIIITPQGTRMSNGSIILTESYISQAIFSISGTQTNTLSVILPTNPIYIYHQNGVNFMYLDSWTIDMPQGGNSTANKDFIVNIGASLRVGPIEANPIGFYSGSYPIIFFYN